MVPRDFEQLTPVERALVRALVAGIVRELRAEEERDRKVFGRPGANDVRSEEAG